MNLLYHDGSWKQSEEGWTDIVRGETARGIKCFKIIPKPDLKQKQKMSRVPYLNLE
jgi:hypothetical protein